MVRQGRNSFVTDANSWFDRIRDSADRLIANPSFQRWATAFPLTRPVARRRSRELFDLCAGFVYTQVLYACVRTGLIEALRDGPLTIHSLAPRLDLPVPAADRLVRAALSLHIVSRRSGDRYGLGRLGTALVGNPGVIAMVEHHALLYADLNDPVDLLRNPKSGETALSSYWPYALDARPDAVEPAAQETGTEQVEPYSDLMAVSQAMIAEDIIASYPFARHRRIMDVGGGNGAFIEHVARKAPDAELNLFDLPAVAEHAKARLTSVGLGDRVRVHGGSFFTDPLPEGADLITLVRIVHDHDDDDVMKLLRGIRKAVPDNGALLIAEPMSHGNDAARVADAYFGLYLLAMGSGRARTVNEITHMLEKAGFSRNRRVRTRVPMLTQAILARPG